MSTLEQIDHAVDVLGKENLLIYHCTVLGDAEPTSSSDVFTAKACIVNGMLDMDQIRTELRLKAIKYGKMIPEGQLSAYHYQQENEPAEEPDYQHILEKYDMERVYAHLAEAKDPSKVDLEGKFNIKQS